MNLAAIPSAQKLRLTVKTKDGRTLQGTYPYLAALARAEWCEQLPHVVESWELEAAR